MDKQKSSGSYPRAVFPILFLEFCERFAFYGTKAILTLYMTRALSLTDNTATSIYHGYVAACYVTPILGGLIADGGLGKYRTIFYFSMLYVVGYILQTVSAIKFNGDYTQWVTYIALVVMAFGSGIIKPCKSALGGDQFTEEQESMKEGFFSWFYMAINVGSLISMFLTPILRSNVSCFDDVECYALAFGVPAALMTIGYGECFILLTRIPLCHRIGCSSHNEYPLLLIFSRPPSCPFSIPSSNVLSLVMYNVMQLIDTIIYFAVVFVAATPMYRKLPTQESVLPRMCSCVVTALKEKGCCKTHETEEEHWLDYASCKFEVIFNTLCYSKITELFPNRFQRDFIEDVKDVMKVLWLFLPLPIFWALFDQQGDFAIEPDQLQVANALFVVVLIPILEGLIFPCTIKLNVMTKPLQRMGVGMFLAGVAFVIAGGLQIAVNNSEPAGIESGTSRLKFINTAQCSVEFTVDKNVMPSLTVGCLEDTDYSTLESGEVSISHTYCGAQNGTETVTFNLIEKMAYTVLSTSEGNDVFLHRFETEKTSRTGNGLSTVWILNTLPTEVDIDLKSDKENEPREFRNISASGGFSQFEELIFDDYDATLIVSDDPEDDINIGKIESKNGAVYTLVLTNVDNGTMPILQQYEDVGPNTVNIFWQIPQYFVMTLGECLFSVTGLAFAYTQAPPSMKSVLTAAWLLTVGVGNIVVIVISESGSQMGQMEEFFLFAGLMFFTLILFTLMAYYYKYVEPREVDDFDPEPPEVQAVEPKSNGYHKNGVTNSAFKPEVDSTQTTQF
ncbi:hypothetical protein CAPTEDRAFT_196600 [Capitella teleta]|uniref:Major facilitator superfamily (MFS) profile domain-containing protein n=1 Tax=Capitella teleta TaxID=283909 RepID=R7UFR2_CAPTE|nr:hypothetical protein CAPTEDRAFT_196600 [Capitella teleta]|eukprot:ELU02117.1 hypothetical protein CAPTEDRAFT_196600 [Capitella teleta]